VGACGEYKKKSTEKKGVSLKKDGKKKKANAGSAARRSAPVGQSREVFNKSSESRAGIVRLEHSVTKAAETY